jgi:Domain of unknown function (DUF4253)
MTPDVQPAGSVISVPRYVWERPKPGISGAIMRLLGFAKAKRRLDRVDEVASPFAYALVSGADAEGAIDDLARLRADGVPAILGTPETAASMLDLPDRKQPQELLAELIQFDPDHWLAERFAELRRAGIEPPRGPWPTDPSDRQESGLACVRRVLGTREFESEIVIALLPIAEPALAALHLGYGDWNDCPSPVVHAAFARRWAVSCGAVPVAFAGDVVEYRVAHPIGTREQALAIALEQFAYCPDIVLQGTETIERLAADLIGARYWFFWWD